jgi:hypothetical protein
MKAITIWQPYASLIATGIKQYETRSWQTNYRGELLIHAAKRPVSLWLSILWNNIHATSDRDISCEASTLPLGAIVAIADLTDCLEIVESDFLNSNRIINKHLQSKAELSCGDWQTGNFAWELKNIKPLIRPIPAKGYQGLWNPPDEIVGKIYETNQTL